MIYQSPFCSRCRVHRPCGASGPSPARVMFIGEGPGQEEANRGVPFIGKSGRELDGQYLPMSGLCRDEVYVTNAIKCRQGKKNGDHPDPDEVLACAKHHLPSELRAVQPEIIVTLGAVALRLFGDHSLELQHGLPIPDQELFGWRGTVFPCYHPAAGLHDSEYMIEIQQDFKALREYRHGGLIVPTDEYPEPYYLELTHPDHLEAVVELPFQAAAATPTPWIEIAVDTETVDGRFWCLTFSPKPGTGYMIRQASVIRAFGLWLEGINPLVLYHNYLYDAPVLRQVGITTPRFRDTMIDAFHLGGVVPQGLKALAYRLCGMRMQDYEDVVLPCAIDAAVEYLALGAKTILPGYIELLPWKQKRVACSGGKAQGGKHPKEHTLFEEPGVGECWLCAKPLKAGKMTRDKGGRQYIWDRAGAILDDVIEKGSNPLKRWAAIPAVERRVIEEVIGPMPRPSIAQVPIPEAIRYACRDADATLRIRPVLARMMAEMARGAHQGA